jgi:hypothetical protein
MRKEADVAGINTNLTPSHLMGGTDESHDNPQDSQSPGGELNPRPLEYEEGMLTIRQNVLYFLS